MSNRVGFLLDYANPDKHYDQVSEMDKHLGNRASPFEVAEHKNVRYTKSMVDTIINHLANNPPWHPVTELLDKMRPHMEDRHIDQLMDSQNTRLQAEGAGMSRTHAHFEKAMAIGRGDFPHIPNHLAARNAISSPIVDSALLHKVIRSDKYPSSARQEAVQSLKAHPDDLEWASNFQNHGYSMMAHKAKEMHSMLKDLNLLEAVSDGFSMDKIPEDSMLHGMGAMSAAMVGGNNFQMHKLGDDAGYLIQYDKGDATEVHHVDKNLQGGSVSNQRPAFKFITTFKKHIQGLLDDGKKVRIVAHHSVADPITKITSKLVERNPEYERTHPVETEHELTGDKMLSWELKKSHKAF